jgi:hypothetical protein
MKVIGLLLALAGWLVPVIGLTATDSMSARLILCAVGMAGCVVGILGFINGSYLKQALWKK